VEPYRIFRDKPLKRRIIISGSVIVKIIGIYLSAGIAVRVIRFNELNMFYDFTTMIIIRKALYHTPEAVCKGDNAAFVWVLYSGLTRLIHLEYLKWIGIFI